nr:DUF1963 domain-containing protein [Sulfitobacter algicola]
MLSGFAKPTIYLHRSFPVPSHLDDTLSYLGGMPMLPADIEWPRTAAGQALHFIAQIDCASLPKTNVDLPDHGLLLFFAMLQDGASYEQATCSDYCSVIHITQQDTPLRQPPDDLHTLDQIGMGMPGDPVLPDDPALRVFTKWPVEPLLIKTWPERLPHMSDMDIVERGYDILQSRMHATQILRATGLIANFQDGKPNRYYGDIPDDPHDGLPFPQTWGVIGAICRAFLGATSDFKSRKGWMNRHYIKSLRKQALGTIKEVRGKSWTNEPTQSERNGFINWLIETRDSAFEDAQHDIEKALSKGMLKAVQDAAVNPEYRAKMPQSYFEDYFWSYTPGHGSVLLNGQARCCIDRHQMLGHRQNGTMPAWWDCDENIPLLQLHSDHALGYIFGDNGLFLEYWINKNDLVQHRFDKAIAFCGL